MENKQYYEKLLINANKLSDMILEQQGIARGLRKKDGNGILVGLTTISENYGKKNNIPCEGNILYRGENLINLINYSYEEIVFLLLFGRLPRKNEIKEFNDSNTESKLKLQPIIKSIIEKENGKNIMNIMARSILNLYDFDLDPENTSLPNMIRQIIDVISVMPIISLNAYIRKKTITEDYHMVSNPYLSTAENILYMLRGEGNYTSLEVKILNVCLILHAELGGGNNSAFTTHVVASTGTDTYAVIAAAIGAIKGPKHGGANIKAFQMMQDMKDKVGDWTDKNLINDYLFKILKYEAFDRSGLIYGVGHRVFTLSDPRTRILKSMAYQLAREKKREDEFELYSLVEELAPKMIQKIKNVDKPICANVDFYSGFVYDMLGIPQELFTPMFVNARIAGWGAHRLEEMCNNAKIIHPTYNYVVPDINKNEKMEEKKYGETIINFG